MKNNFNVLGKSISCYESHHAKRSVIKVCPLCTQRMLSCRRGTHDLPPLSFRFHWYCGRPSPYGNLALHTLYYAPMVIGNTPTPIEDRRFPLPRYSHTSAAVRKSHLSKRNHAIAAGIPFEVPRPIQSQFANAMKTTTCLGNAEQRILT